MRGELLIFAESAIRHTHVPSPDRAKVLMSAFGEAPPVYEFTSVRDFERPKLPGQKCSRRPRRSDERQPGSAAVAVGKRVLLVSLKACKFHQDQSCGELPDSPGISNSPHARAFA
jgi:hypothetical protein